MKIIRLGLLMALFLPLVSWAQTPTEQVESLLQSARSTGSHLDYAQAQLLNNRHNLKLNTKRVRLSRYGLASDAFGGFSIFEGTYRGSLDLFTGQRAVDESLQLDTIESHDTSLEDRSLPLEEVAALTIESHPWQEMLSEIKDPPKPRAIMDLVPHDHFVIHFRSGAVVKDLESTLSELSEGLNQLFDLEKSLQIRQMVAERLDLEKSVEHQADLGEVVFVSEDLDFFPSTHYALIISLNSPEKLPRASLARSDRRGRVGDYFVVASSAALFQRIESVHRGELKSMAESLDYQYADAVLDRPRDAMIYLSEAFILNLVSPRYRIQSSRRLAAMDNLVQAQYRVWAYRCLTGHWPQSLSQMAQEGYLTEGDVHPQLGIASNGLVVHQTWGSLANLKALSDAELLGVSDSEVASYDLFRERYQDYWTKYFDPIGVGIQVGDDLRFHTIILPLIDNSDYRRLAQFAGGPLDDFDGLARARQVAGVSLHSRFSFEGFVRALDGDRDVDPEIWRAKINADLNRELGVLPPVDVFSIFGDEVTAILIPEAVSLDKSIANFGAFACELRDREEFQRTVALLLKDSDRKAQTHAGVEFFETPFYGSTHLYAIYQDGFVYLSLDRGIAHHLCEAFAQGHPPGDFDQEPHNLFWRADFQRNDLLLRAYRELATQHGLERQFSDALAYMADRETLASEGVDTGGLLNFGPQRLYGVPLERTAEGSTVGGLSPDQVQLGRPTTVGNAIALSALIRSFETEQTRRAIQQLQWLTIGLDFTPEGLSTRVRVNRPKNSRTWF